MVFSFQKIKLFSFCSILIISIMILSILLQASMSTGNNYSGLVMIAIIFVIMYFFMIRPQQKQKKKIEELRKSLKIGDKIITSSGIHGKLREINDVSYLIEISEGVKITVDKVSVFAVSDELDVQKKNKS